MVDLFRRRPWDGVGLALIGLSSVILIGIGFFTSFVPPDGVTLYEFLAGGKGFVDYLLSALTLLGAATTVTMLFVRAKVDSRQLAIAEENAQLAIYKEAAQLAASDKPSAAFSGMFLMRKLAMINPEAYQSIARSSLTVLATAHGDAHFEALTERYHDNTKAMPAKLRSNRISAQALRTVGSLRELSENSWRGSSVPAISNLFLGTFSIYGANFSGMDIFAIAHDVSFANCRFSGAKVRFCVIGQLTLFGCDLAGAQIEIIDFEKAETINRKSSGLLVISDATIDGASILNEEPLTSGNLWLGDAGRTQRVYDPRTSSEVKR